MKKYYEKPVLTTEQFDADDIIAASSPTTQQPARPDFAGTNWEIPGLGLDLSFSIH